MHVAHFGACSFLCFGFAFAAQLRGSLFSSVCMWRVSLRVRVCASAQHSRHGCMHAVCIVVAVRVHVARSRAAAHGQAALLSDRKRQSSTMFARLGFLCCACAAGFASAAEVCFDVQVSPRRVAET